MSSDVLGWRGGRECLLSHLYVLWAVCGCCDGGQCQRDSTCVISRTCAEVEEDSARCVADFLKFQEDLPLAESQLQNLWLYSDQVCCVAVLFLDGKGPPEVHFIACRLHSRKWHDVSKLWQKRRKNHCFDSEYLHPRFWWERMCRASMWRLFARLRGS